MSITLVRTDIAGIRDSITAYLADASRNIEEGSAPVIQPPTEGQLQQEISLPQLEPTPKRPRGRPQKSRSSVQSPKKKPRGKLTDEQRVSVIKMYQKRTLPWLILLRHLAYLGVMPIQLVKVAKLEQNHEVVQKT